MSLSRCISSYVPPALDRRRLSLGWVCPVLLGSTLAFGCDLTSSPEPVPQEYYGVERDTRRCASPFCGGYFLSALNQPDTLCFDGSRSERCYVAEVDLAAFGSIPLGRGLDIVRGALEPLDLPVGEGLARLVAQEAWSEVGTGEALFTYFRVADNGIRCITTPCFSVSAESLNSDQNNDFSNLDLGNSGLNDNQQAEALQALSNGNLLLNGLATPDPGQSGIGTALAAARVYLPLSTAGCEVDEDCGAGQWCRSQGVGLRCVPFVDEGASCEGFRIPEFFERCAPGLQCDLQDPTGDLGGVCRRPCSSNSDCSDEQFCAEEGLCHQDGACETLSDCSLLGNDYPVVACIGELTCSAIGNESFGTREGVCGIDCGVNPIAQ